MENKPESFQPSKASQTFQYFEKKGRLVFSSQKVTSNFISGIIILFEKTVQNDDLIELNDGTLGFLRNTGSRASLIETYDGKEVMVPNEDLITNRVINYTHSNKKARIKINIGVSYDCDLEIAQKLILEALCSFLEQSEFQLTQEWQNMDYN